jgi:hypothetical protein
MNKDDAVTPQRATKQPEKQPGFWQQIRAHGKASYAKVGQYYRRHKKPIASLFCGIWRILTYDFVRDNSVIALFTALIFFGAVVYSYFAYLQWQAIEESNRVAQTAANAARRATDITASELELSQRPWISVSFSAVSPLVIDAQGLRVSMQTTIDNVGHSPAVKGAESTKLYTSFLLRPDPWKMRDESCREAEMMSNGVLANTKVGLTQTWFPGNQPPRIAMYSISRAEIMKGMVQRNEFGLGETPPPWYAVDIAYCVAYYSSFGNKQYHTGYLLQIVRNRLLPPAELVQNFSLESETTPVTIIYGAFSGLIPMGPDAN